MDGCHSAHMNNIVKANIQPPSRHVATDACCCVCLDSFGTGRREVNKKVAMESRRAAIIESAKGIVTDELKRGNT